jgi:hypothetical protein
MICANHSAVSFGMGGPVLTLRALGRLILPRTINFQSKILRLTQNRAKSDAAMSRAIRGPHLSHIITALTGGFFLHQRDLGPNIAKCIILSLIIALFIPLLVFRISGIARLAVSAALGAYILILKSLAMFIHRRLDDSIDSPDSAPVESPELPPGISLQIWNARSVMFDTSLTMDQRVSHLWSSGFDLDEVFRLAELVRTNAITASTEIVDAPPLVRETSIRFGGRSFNIPMNRAYLSRIIGRPSGCLDLIVAFGMASCVGYFVCPENWRWFSVLWLLLVCSLSVFSMLLPPPCDPYSTTLNDPAIGFTRCFTILVICGIEKLAKLLVVWGYVSKATMDFAHPLFVLALLGLPVLILCGVIGHPICVTHWFLEFVSKYAFGFCGSPSLWLCFSNLASSVWYSVVIWGVCILLGPRRLANIFAVSCAAFAVRSGQWQARLSRSVMSALFATGGSFLPCSVLARILAIFHLLGDVCLPFTSTYQRYGWTHGLLGDEAVLVRDPPDSFFATLPLLLGSILRSYDCPNWMVPLLCLAAVRQSASEPHIFAFALILMAFTFNSEIPIERKWLALYLGMAVAQKVHRMIGIVDVAAKRFGAEIGLFEDPLRRPEAFAAAWSKAASMYGVILFHDEIFYPALLWSCVTEAPLMFFRGNATKIRPSSLRPNAFFESASLSKTHTGFHNIDHAHRLEIPVYVSMERELERNLCNWIKAGRFGLVTNNSLFLLTDGSLVVLLHIIAMEPDCVYFQMRGLEYVQQTACHGGELRILRMLAAQETRGPNIQHGLAFKYSMYDLRVKCFKMEMVTVAKYNFTTGVYAVLGNGFFDSVYRAMVYKFALGFQTLESEFVPPDYSELSDEERPFLQKVFEHFGVAEDDTIVKKIIGLWKAVRASLVVDGHLDTARLQAFFDGECGDETDGEWIAESIRFAVLLAFTESAGLAPTLDDLDEFISYLDEQNQQLVLPSSDVKLSSPDEQTEDVVLSMRIFTSDPDIVRYSKGEICWNVFEMDTECVRAFWANEVIDLLFKALTSGERPGVSFDAFQLRNLTNQACNQPVGYPVAVSNVNRSPMIRPLAAELVIA